MIRNERQYRITSRQRQLLADALEEAAARREHQLSEAAGLVGQDDLLRFELEQASIEGQLSDLDVQLREYEQLRAGARDHVHVTSFGQLPKALVQARIAAGWSQRDLAERLGLKEQQIQRYEAEDYASASLSRLEEVRSALGVEIDAGIQLPAVDSPLQRLKRRLRKLGLDRSVIDHRIMRDMGELASPAKALAIAERASRLLGLDVQQLLSPDDTVPALATTARFKAPANASAKKLDAYTRYAEGLADIVLKATAGMPEPRLPGTAQATREEINSLLTPPSGGVDRSSDGRASSEALFEAVVQYLFLYGIPVVALRDPGAFHGACFTSDDRSVIVLKQTTDSTARWVNDLLHESGHLRDPQKGTARTWIELGEIKTWSDDPEEQRANGFAADVLFEGRARPVLEACFTQSGGSVERLKRVVPKVAQEADVPADVLANYVAFQLSRQGTNWWPTAAGFQQGQTPWRTVTNILIKHLDFTLLDTVERAALLDALAA
jgi:transcriptional regulator with XRE-family HTH domain